MTDAVRLQMDHEHVFVGVEASSAIENEGEALSFTPLLFNKKQPSSSYELGETYDDLSEELLCMLLEDIEAGDKEFMILECVAVSSGPTYIQSMRNSDGTFDVERREGSPDHHYHANVADMPTAHATVMYWAFETAPKVDSIYWCQARFDNP